MSRDPSARRPKIPLSALEADIHMNRLGCRQGVGFCRSLIFALIRSTVQLCCGAIGGNRPSPVISPSSANGRLITESSHPEVYSLHSSSSITPLTQQFRLQGVSLGLLRSCLSGVCMKPRPSCCGPGECPDGRARALGSRRPWCRGQPS